MASEPAPAAEHEDIHGKLVHGLCAFLGCCNVLHCTQLDSVVRQVTQEQWHWLQGRTTLLLGQRDWALRSAVRGVLNSALFFPTKLKLRVSDFVISITDAPLNFLVSRRLVQSPLANLFVSHEVCLWNVSIQEDSVCSCDILDDEEATAFPSEEDEAMREWRPEFPDDHRCWWK